MSTSRLQRYNQVKREVMQWVKIFAFSNTSKTMMPIMLRQVQHVAKHKKCDIDFSASFDEQA